MSTSYSPAIVRTGLVLALDAANPKSYSPNVHPYPTDIYAWTVGTNGACTIARDTTTSKSPANGIPLAMTITANDPYMATYQSTAWTLAPAKAGETWTVSVWVKTSLVSGFAQIFIFGVDATGTYNNLGGVGGSDTGATNVTFTSTEWTRISVARTFTNVSVTGIQIRLDGTDVPTVGQVIWWDGLQVEKNSPATTFNPRTNVNGTWTGLTNTVNGTVVGVVAPLAVDITTCFNFAANLGLNGTTAISGYSWNPHPIPTTGSFTFNCWVKNVPVTVGQGLMFSNTASADGFRFSIGADGVYYLIGPTYTEGMLAFTSFTNTQWNNVCVVFDRNGTYNAGVAQLRGYLNGTLYGSVTLPASQTAFTGVGAAYMSKGIGTFGSFSGKLSKFDIYARALSVAEISQNFNALRGRHGL